MNCYKPADLRRGRSMLVCGADGAIGTAGVQLARHFGAEVTAVCGTKDVEVIRSLGADRVIGCLREDFTQNGETYDVIFDAVGKHSFKRSRDSLKPGGLYLATDGLENLILALWTSRSGEKKVIFQIPPRQTKEDVRFLKELIETGEDRPVIERPLPAAEEARANPHVQTGPTTGNGA